jgi:hypothetical protein
MPLQNRVAPNGEIFATSARGTFLGNRGILHNDVKQIVRQSRTAMWLICRLEFNGRKQELMHPNRYTQLFFLDEAVALAAGHRPCGECRRTQYRAYIDAANVETDNAITGAKDLDKQLDAWRKTPRTSVPIASLPDGAFIDLGDNDFRLIWLGVLYRWSPEGYTDSIAIAIADLDIAEALVVTPRLSVEALRQGYPVSAHPSAAPGAPKDAVPKPVQIPRSAPSVSTVDIREGASVSELPAELRADIEQILRTSSPGLTHGEVFRHMERGLNAEQIASERDTGLPYVKAVCRSLQHLLNGTMPTSKSDAKTNSMVYKELLNYHLSPALLSHVKARLRSLMEIDPEINMEPLRTRSHQYSAKASSRATRENICPKCNLDHPGDCD